MKRKAHTNPLDLNELKLLYCEEGFSLRAIAKRFGVTYQAIHDRLVRAGITRRKRGEPKKEPVAKETLQTLYLLERLSVTEIAKRLKMPQKRIYAALRFHSIPRIKRAQRSELGKLSVGGVIELPAPKRRRFYSNIYGQAKHAGIRVSIKTIDKDRIEVRRVA